MLECLPPQVESLSLQCHAVRILRSLCREDEIVFAPCGLVRSRVGGSIQRFRREVTFREAYMKTNLKSTFLLAVLSVFAAGWMHSQGAAADIPKSGQSKTIDAIKKEGKLRVGIMAGYPWLEENTSGQGEPYSGPAWILANSYAKLLGVKLELIPVSHETKVPVVQNGQAQMSIAPLSVTPPRQKVVDFVVYSNSSICMFGKADNPKLAGVKMVDDLNREEISIAYFTGGAEESWVPKRFPKAQSRGVSGSGTAAPSTISSSIPRAIAYLLAKSMPQSRHPRASSASTLSPMAPTALSLQDPGTEFCPFAGNGPLEPRPHACRRRGNHRLARYRIRRDRSIRPLLYLLRFLDLSSFIGLAFAFHHAPARVIEVDSKRSHQGLCLRNNITLNLPSMYSRTRPRLGTGLRNSPPRMRGAMRWPNAKLAAMITTRVSK
jgi:ABC-type amino acid transport substrate-binding protein